MKRHDRSLRGDRGTTLVEVVVAVFLIVNIVFMKIMVNIKV